MRKSFLAIAILVFSFGANLGAQELKHFNMKHQKLDREYFLYVPEDADADTPLVFMLHGYGGKADGYRPEMARTAKAHGFALCVPDGWPAPKTGKKGWNVRYPKQEGMESDDVAFILALTRKLQKQYGFRKDRTFLCGMSNGGEMCYILAWKHPEAYRALASVAGLTMAWLPEENRLPDAHVPFIEFHGTGDHTSEWGGDPIGQFGWGEYLSVPLAVGNIVTMNRCRAEEVTELPLLHEDSNRVILHRYIGGDDEVRLYEVVGAKHGWFLNDIDTCEEIWKFFEQYL